MDAVDEWGELVERLVVEGVVRSPAVERALRSVPRLAFVPREHRGAAHTDVPVPLPGGQTVSAPHMVALMAEALDVRPGHRVLEIGAGSGYHAAILAHLAGPDGVVHTVERLPALARQAEEALRRIPEGARVRVHVGDGSQGLPSHAPYDRISVAAGAPRVPPSLVAQLAPDGVLVVPVGDRHLQTLVRARHDGHGGVQVEPLLPCAFVPLVGRHGFPESTL